MILSFYRCSWLILFKSTPICIFFGMQLIIQSCGMFANDKGEIIAKYDKKTWRKETPLGMVFVPGGTFLMGGGVNQSVICKTNFTKTTTVGSFYMDETEVTVAQYLRFIDIVREDPQAYDLDESYIDAKLIPDLTVWKKDFGFMFMDDSFGKIYCKDPSFSDHPIVGITFEAAQQFARVRSIYRNKYLESKGLLPAPNFRLPTAAEWEYAAKSGRLSGQYPWGGPSVRNEAGKLLANFQFREGDYAASGYTYTSPVKAFPPNEYGLYDMAGNVSEWCEDVYSPLLIHKNKTISDFYKNEETPFRVIKGGSWKDYSYALQTGVFDCEKKNISRSYIGFRCVMFAM